MPGVDMSAIVDRGARISEALMEANKATYQSMQALARKQAEILSQTIQGMQEAAQIADRQRRKSGAADRRCGRRSRRRWPT